MSGRRRCKDNNSKRVAEGGGGKMGEADVIENAVNNKVHGAIYGILYMCGI